MDPSIRWRCIQKYITRDGDGAQRSFQIVCGRREDLSLESLPSTTLTHISYPQEKYPLGTGVLHRRNREVKRGSIVSLLNHLNRPHRAGLETHELLTQLPHHLVATNYPRVVDSKEPSLLRVESSEKAFEPGVSVSHRPIPLNDRESVVTVLDRLSQKISISGDLLLLPLNRQRGRQP